MKNAKIFSPVATRPSHQKSNLTTGPEDSPLQPFPSLPLTPFVQLLTVPARLTLRRDIRSDSPAPPPRPHEEALILLDRKIRRQTCVELCVCAVDGRIEQDFSDEVRDGPLDGPEGAGVSLEFCF